MTSRIANFACTYPAAAANYALGLTYAGVAAQYALVGRPGDAVTFGVMGAATAGVAYGLRKIQEREWRPYLTFGFTAMPYHLIEELFLYQMPVRALFTHLTGLDPEKYADVHLPEYAAFILGLPFAAGAVTALAHRYRMRRKNADAVLLRVLQHIQIQEENDDAQPALQATENEPGPRAG